MGQGRGNRRAWQIRDREIEWRPFPFTARKARNCDCGVVEIDRVLGDLTDHIYLRGSLRTLDVLNGCFNQCDTCLADSPFPTSAMSIGSLDRLFDSDAFLGMLQPDSLRFGSCGDITDHAGAVHILETALCRTEGLNRSRQERECKFHTVKVYTNYRPHKEDMLDRVLALTNDWPERLMISVSLPLNRNDSINRAFLDYAKARPQYFKVLDDCFEDGYPEIEGSLKWGGAKIGVWDVGHPRWLLMVGRTLSPYTLRKKAARYSRLPRFRELEIEQNGFVKTYLNAEGLWLMKYTTAYESHTCRLFTPITPDTIELLAQLPYHPDFAEPPYWPGKRGERIMLSDAEVQEREAEYHSQGLRKKRLRVAR